MDLLSTADAALGIVTNICYLIGLGVGSWLFIKGRNDRNSKPKENLDEKPDDEENESESSSDRDTAE